MVNLRSRYPAKEIAGKAGLLAILELLEVDYWAITLGQAAVGKIEFHPGRHQNERIQQPTYPRTVHYKRRTWKGHIRVDCLKWELVAIWEFGVFVKEHFGFHKYLENLFLIDRGLPVMV